MGDRGIQLASRIEQQNSELARFLNARTESDLRLACADPSGSTVDAVLSHLAEGYDLVLGWLEGVANGEPPGPAGHEHHHHGNGSGNLSAYIEHLSRGGRAWESLTRGLSDAQLEQVPPATPDITDGTAPLAEIIDRMIEHQAIHVDYIRNAVTEPAAPATGTA